MKYIDRMGQKKDIDSSQDKFLKLLYTNVIGRFVVKLLVSPCVSQIGGKLLSSSISKVLIPPFVKANNIDLSIYEEKDFVSYNDFFIRKIKKEQREINMDSDILISPCDAKLSVYNINDKQYFSIKNTVYSTKSLLKDKHLAEKYQGGYAMVFRLTVDDYHRYCYVDNGYKTDNTVIPGVLHTVNPIANDVRPIYKENTRAYSTLHSENFGDILMMEVGALMVGKIVNYHQSRSVSKGQEKGRFEFGGSTVLLLLEKDKVVVDPDLLENTKNGYETIVKMGENIGRKYNIE